MAVMTLNSWAKAARPWLLEPEMEGENKKKKKGIFQVEVHK
jgi:hypothetical protein